jgi:hypothetical protein
MSRGTRTTPASQGVLEGALPVGGLEFLQVVREPGESIGHAEGGIQRSDMSSRILADDLPGRRVGVEQRAVFSEEHHAFRQDREQQEQAFVLVAELLLLLPDPFRQGSEAVSGSEQDRHQDQEMGEDVVPALLVEIGVDAVVEIEISDEHQVMVVDVDRERIERGHQDQRDEKERCQAGEEEARAPGEQHRAGDDRQRIGQDERVLDVAGEMEEAGEGDQVQDQEHQRRIPGLAAAPGRHEAQGVVGQDRRTDAQKLPWRGDVSEEIRQERRQRQEGGHDVAADDVPAKLPHGSG